MQPIEPRTTRWTYAIAAAACLVSATTPAAAQRGLLLQGIFDVEGWSTNATSNLLTKNHGRLAGLARLQAWGAIEPLPSIVLYAQGEAETGSASPTSSGRAQTEQFGVRYGRSERLVIDAGRLTPVIGTFASRHFSTRNPLIGEPDGYTLEYPYGIKLSGEVTHADYRVALVSLPTTHANYQPTPTARLRPAVGFGVTPMVGLRIGGSFTMGPYLNRSMDSILPTSTAWTDYDQRVAAIDFSFSRGYLETHAEAARGSYEVPGRATPITGFTYYGEAKYTLSPRFYVAARAERNNYPAIRRTTTTWVSRTWDFVDGEAGIGVRLATSTLLKASYLADRWWVPPTAPGFRGQGGHAIALQLSQAFDVMGLLERSPIYR
ncbi:MAG TPA: hypothetical protein VGP95_09535 [Gemmatimonadaceae bacterium]|nr:hypothetical protein [Gemmatimonadaceae bacterium]